MENILAGEHIQQLYDRDQRKSGLKLLPKIKREHIKLTAYSKMRVDLAAQILSSSVSCALEYYDEEETTETRIFVKQFDRFFDCLNGRYLTEETMKLKPDLRPYKDPNDSRLSWLENDFLLYLQNWEDVVKQRKGFTMSQKKKMLLSDETLEGLRLTVKSFVELTRILLTVPGVEYLLSEKFCQDPLESFFGHQRAQGGYSNNPSVQRFLDNTASLRVQKSAALEPVCGNCRKRCRSPSAGVIVDSDRLPKCNRRTSKK